MIENGLVQIYTGDGKGKTTAALGLSLRACGDGNKVLFYQFLKPADLKLSERESVKKYGLDIDFRTIDVDWNMWTSPDSDFVRENAKKQIVEAFSTIISYAKNQTYNLIVLDEIVYCLNIGLIKLTLIEQLVQEKHKDTEIILTGRGANNALFELADLVSEIKCVKHPYEKGIIGRKGVEF